MPARDYILKMWNVSRTTRRHTSQGIIDDPTDTTTSTASHNAVKTAFVTDAVLLVEV